MAKNEQQSGNTAELGKLLKIEDYVTLSTNYVFKQL